MTAEPEAPGLRIEDITARAAAGVRTGGAPVHLWDPPYCGDLDMCIAGDGTWFYLKTPIRRPALVRLFASVLKREGDKYFLVTPVEKCGIAVDDAPFLAVELKASANGKREQVLDFRTNVDDWVTCSRDHRCDSNRKSAPADSNLIYTCAQIYGRCSRVPCFTIWSHSASSAR